jgi:hypothetical protein
MISEGYLGIELQTPYESQWLVRLLKRTSPPSSPHWPSGTKTLRVWKKDIPHIVPNNLKLPEEQTLASWAGHNKMREIVR